MRLRSAQIAPPSRRPWAAYGVVAIALIATAISAVYIFRNAQESDERRFEREIDSAITLITRRTEEHLGVLYGARSLLMATGQADRATFREYVEGLDLETRAPGVLGVGFTQFIPPDELERHQERIRAEGFPDYEVWPPGPRDAYTAIVFLEPFHEMNRRAFGFDMRTEPVRREAMERSRATGQPAASGRVVLVQEPSVGGQPGFLTYLPMFEDGPGTRLLGWVYSPYRAHELFRHVFGVEQEHGHELVDIEVYDGDRVDPATLLYDADGGPDEVPRRITSLQREVPLEIAGRRWTLRFTAHPEFFHDSPRANAGYAGLSGLVISLLLFAIVRAQATGRAEAEERQHRSAFLAEAARLLNASLDYASTLEQVAHVCATSMADWCVIYLVDEANEELRAVAAAHRDPERSAWAKDFLRRFPPDPRAMTGIAQVVRTGSPELAPDIPPEVLEKAARSPEQAAAFREAKLRSFMAVPLITRGSAIGAIAFVSGRSHAFGKQELDTAEELARLAASAVDNARLYARAQEAIRLRDEFLSVASHELKTPLTSMSLKVESLRRISATPRADGQERQARALDVLMRQMTRLTRLVNSLLDVSRLSAGRFKLDLQEVDAAALAQEVAQAMQDEFELANCTLTLDMSEAVPGLWDRMRLEQVIANLLSNAIKYGHDHPVHLTVDGDEEVARIVVRDQGIGIDPEDLARVFERFERAAPAENYGGLGLGLYISKQIVQAMGGQISVTSRAGEGSTFTVELPRTPNASTAPAI